MSGIQHAEQFVQSRELADRFETGATQVVMRVTVLESQAPAAVYFNSYGKISLEGSFGNDHQPGGGSWHG